jgi:hypothetical protein
VRHTHVHPGSALPKDALEEQLVSRVLGRPQERDGDGLDAAGEQSVDRALGLGAVERIRARPW